MLSPSTTYVRNTSKRITEIFNARPLTFDVALEDVIDDGIDVLLDVLHQHREAVLDGHLQLTQEVAVAERHNLPGGTQTRIHEQKNSKVSNG